MLIADHFSKGNNYQITHTTVDVLRETHTNTKTNEHTFSQSLTVKDTQFARRE